MLLQRRDSSTRSVNTTRRNFGRDNSYDEESALGANEVQASEESCADHEVYNKGHGKSTGGTDDAPCRAGFCWPFVDTFI